MAWMSQENWPAGTHLRKIRSFVGSFFDESNAETPTEMLGLFFLLHYLYYQSAFRAKNHFDYHRINNIFLNAISSMIT